MAAKKPETLQEYEDWLRAEHSIDSIEMCKQHYKTVSEELRDGFQNGNFWSALSSAEKLRDYDEEYRLANDDYPLLASREPPNLMTKGFDSFFLKTYRINVLQNRRWPKQPFWLGQHAWILPSNWFSAINDIVRTTFVVKYFDGVKFLVAKLDDECERSETRCKCIFQAREEGHYAAHFYVTYNCEITSMDSNREKIPATTELQITTQLQDVIREMLHKHYERRREQADRSDEWKWDHKSNEFATNYLGHILHYLEGIIVDIRDKQREQL